MSDALPPFQWYWDLDGWIILAGIFCSASAALLGSFLVLRRMSMLGDAISHAVLPGLAAAFFLTGSRQSSLMFIGAILVGVLTSWLTQWTRQIGKVDEGAAIGVVFTGLFALGLVMIVRGADSVDLDPGCVLYGSIELTPLDRYRFAGLEIPRAVFMLGSVFLINLTAIVLFYRRLKITSFDPALADSLGISSRAMHYLLAALVALTAVASFESVGNILVVAMLIVPPATAALLTDRLSSMLVVSVALGILATISGHLGAITIPRRWGYSSVSTAGGMTIAAGILLVGTIVFAPRTGLVWSVGKRWLWGIRVNCEDVLALLYRKEERGETGPTANTLSKQLLLSHRSLWLCRCLLSLRSYVRVEKSEWKLTERGRMAAQDLVRSHRLWENYFASEVGLSNEQLHQPAERLEHFTGSQIRKQLLEHGPSQDVDPHGKPIPPERNPSP
jgi:manganese/zinc/iron transport system permease protein